jgi:hypothetical protein
VASASALKALLDALQAEQTRRRKAQFGGHDDPRQWLLDTLQTMAQRLAATAHLYPLSIADMSIMERLACRYFLPEDLCPVGLESEDAIWAEFEARSRSQPSTSR